MMVVTLFKWLSEVSVKKERVCVWGGEDVRTKLSVSNC